MIHFVPFQCSLRVSVSATLLLMNKLTSPAEEKDK